MKNFLLKDFCFWYVYSFSQFIIYIIIWTKGFCQFLNYDFAILLTCIFFLFCRVESVQDKHPICNRTQLMALISMLPYWVSLFDSRKCQNFKNLKAYQYNSNKDCADFYIFYFLRDRKQEDMLFFLLLIIALYD